MNDTAVKVRGLRKKYGRTVAVDGIDFEVKTGSVHGFLGPNGAGKTTVIKSLLGLVFPDDGDIEIFGMDFFSSTEEILRQVGSVVEAPVFFEYLTAYENLSFFSRISGTGISADKIFETLELVGLENVADRNVGTFSYGMKQRLGIAQALLPDNKLIFLDEPTNGLDPHGIAGVRKLIRGLSQEKGVTVFLSSHLLSEVEQVCNFVTIIDKGRKICESRVSALLSGHRMIQFTTPDAARFAKFAEGMGLKILEQKTTGGTGVFLFEMEECKVPAFAETMVSEKIGILEIRRHKKTLEEVFVEHTGKDRADAVSDRF